MVEKINYSGGDSYEGEIKDGKRHGKGVYRWASGMVYEGYWADGKKHGLGKWTWPEGHVYEGIFIKGFRVSGIFTGKGEIKKAQIWGNDESELNTRNIFLSKIMFEWGTGNENWGYYNGEVCGEDYNIFPFGHGKLVNEKEGWTFEGEFFGDTRRLGNGKWSFNNLNNKICKSYFTNSCYFHFASRPEKFALGFGELEYIDGTIYSGRLCYFETNINGKMIYPNGYSLIGDFYKCEFNHNDFGSFIVPNGKGKLLLNNNTLAEGQFSNGGQGLISCKITYKNGDCYDGHIFYGKKHGIGKYISTDGEIYSGVWKDDKKNGKGKITDRFGNNYEGRWENDVFITPKISYDQPIAATNSGIYFDTNSKVQKIPDFIDIGLKQNPDNQYKDLKGPFTSLNLDDLIVPFANTNGIIFSWSDEDEKLVATNCLQKIGYRLLCCLPLNKIKFHLIDYDKHGMSFDSFLGLHDKILTKDIWTTENAIEKGLSEIRNSISDITTRLLQNKYKNLSEYNEKVPQSRQPFQFLFIANFPNGFDRSSINLLLNIIKNGSRVGIYVLMSIDDEKTEEYEDIIDDFLDITTLVRIDHNRVENLGLEAYFYSLDDTIPANAEQIKEQINKAINEEKTIEVECTIPVEQEWKSNSAQGVSIPIGTTLNNEPLSFVLGHNSNVHHALVGGATGSGKSVLLHNIILNGSLLYSPDDLQFVLMDYKEGTEFKIYEQLPSVKILSITGEREFGLSVFEFLVDEISKRGELFKQFGSGNIDEYIKSSGIKLPRYLVVIDEFQVLLSGEDNISSKARTLFEDISRRGRSFGINMILATQSFGDVDISSSTMSNIGLRIGLKMPEIDCSRILASDNDVPVSFSKAGQALYNTQNGLKVGNTLFQCAYISKKELGLRIDYLTQKAKNNASELQPFKQYIFDGDISASLKNNKVIEQWAINPPNVNDRFCYLYIGEPSYLQEEHCKFKLRTEVASNLLIAGESPIAAISVVYHSIQQAIKQSSDESKFYIFDLFDVDSGFGGQFEELKSEIPLCKVYSKTKALQGLLDEIKTELDARINEEGSKGRIVVSILNSHKIRELLKDGGYTVSLLGTTLYELIKDGPEYGIHFILHSISHNKLMDCFEPNLFREFENIILLKGESPEKYNMDYSLSTIVSDKKIYLISPTARYKADVVNVYELIN